jgi:hypothetical protein
MKDTTLDRNSVFGSNKEESSLIPLPFYMKELRSGNHDSTQCIEHSLEKLCNVTGTQYTYEIKMK